jgi:hypothetical protein
LSSCKKPGGNTCRRAIGKVERRQCARDMHKGSLIAGTRPPWHAVGLHDCLKLETVPQQHCHTSSLTGPSMRRYAADMRYSKKQSRNQLAVRCTTKSIVHRCAACILQ